MLKSSFVFVIVVIAVKAFSFQCNPVLKFENPPKYKFGVVFTMTPLRNQLKMVYWTVTWYTYLYLWLFVHVYPTPQTPAPRLYI